MNALEISELLVRSAGVALVGVAWVAAAAGASEVSTRRTGRTSGLATRMPGPSVYLLGAIPYFAVCIVLWRPLPIDLTQSGRVICVVAGGLLGAAGAALYLGGRRALGSMYNVSSSLGSELYADHELVTNGPYAYVRHPMYLGLMLAATGGLLVYRTWTLGFMAAALVGAAIKAGGEERLLAAEFGPDWFTYAERVPAWIPHMRHPRKEVLDDRLTTSGA